MLQLLSNTPLRYLDSFIAVADAGGSRAAAEQLERTSGSLVTDIASLEKILGRRLLNRAGRSIRLSRAGKASLPLVRAYVVCLRDLALRLEFQGLQIDLERI